MQTISKNSAKSWLAFDLNVLRRLKFESVALPFAAQPALGAYLKHWNVRVAANNPTQSAYVRSMALIGNSSEALSDDDVNIVLNDAYVPSYRLSNPALASWFSETDSWWFDNVRRNIDKLTTPMLRALASSLAIETGDYVLSFTEQTRELRQPLSNVFRRLWSRQPDPFNNGQSNTCQNKNADDFVSENPADLMFLRLPASHALSAKSALGISAWREEWLRAGDDFWDDFETAGRGKLGTATETKSQYLDLLEELLRRSTHIRTWAIGHAEDGFIQTSDLTDTIGRVRRVDTVFTKDFSELTGTKAVIITA